MRSRQTLLVLTFFSVVSSPAVASSTRVFVKSTGSDVGSCPITSPCRSFSYAMTQVAPSGEIIALDTAGYGTFTISQSVSVFAAPGVTAFIAVGSGGIGITIAAGSNDRVALRGLALTGIAANQGVDFHSGSLLSIENCVVSGFGGSGVQLYRTDNSSARMWIDRTTLRNNDFGIYAASVGGPTAGVTITNSSSSENNTVGFYAADNTRAAVTDSVFASNDIGIIANTDSDNSAPQVNLERCTISQNATTGVQAGQGSGQNNHGIVRIAHNQITGNNLGVFESADGLIMTMTATGGPTNTIEGNQTDGTFSGTYAAK